MENNILSKKEIEGALCDVRKAHRLLYQYQKRVIDIVYYIREKFKMPEFAGVKRFSEPIKKTLSLKDEYKEANLKVFKDMCGWDFLYSYEFEFHLGSNILQKKQYSISVIQVSDSGYYTSNTSNKTKTNISSFEDVESSSTSLILVCETIDNKKNASYLWEVDEAIEILLTGKGLYEKNSDSDNYFIAIKYDLAEFSNQESTDKVIEKFSKYIEEKTGVRLLENKS